MAAPCADVVTAVQHYLDRLGADGPEPDPTEERRLSIVKRPDGGVTGRFDLDPVGGERLQAALESLVQAGRPAADERTRNQQRADALVQLADNALAADGLPVLRGHRPQVIVTVAVEDLADPAVGRGAAELGFGATISAARALAGLRRAGHPDRDGPRWHAAGPRPHRPTLSAAGAAGRGGA
jgi:hypothetical protein